MINSKSNFHDVFGDYQKAYTEEERKDRWEKWKGANPKSLVELFQDTEACAGCFHLDEKESWCRLRGLPCTVNPIFGLKMIGMACQGVGKELRQKELFSL